MPRVPPVISAAWPSRRNALAGSNVILLGPARSAAGYLPPPFGTLAGPAECSTQALAGRPSSSQVEPGLAFAAARCDRVHVALAQNEVLVAPDLDFVPGVGGEQHEVALLDVPDGGSDRDHFGPPEPLIAIGGRGDHNADA